MVKLLTKYVIIIYALSSGHEKFGIKASKLFQSPSKTEIPSRARQVRMAEPFQIETGVPNWFRRQIFHVINSLY